MKKPRSLQARLLALVLGLVALAWLAMGVRTWVDARHELDELLDAHLAQAASLLVAREAGEFDDDRRIDAPALHRYAPRVAFQVFHEGRLALRSQGAPQEPLVAQGAGMANGFSTVRLEGEAWRVFATRGAQRDVQVYVAERMESRGSILKAVLRSVLAPMAIVLPLLALVLGWAVYSGFGPLRALGRQVAGREPGSIEPVHVADAPSEMAPLVDALNALFVRIGTLLESERRFTADAAHELRTPIAAIRTHAQVALGEADDALRARALQATIQGCDRAARLVDQMLTLARLEAGDAPALHPVDVAQVARDVVAQLASQAVARDQSIELHADAPCLADGDATLLAVLVRNLADNALRYSPEGARVIVRATHEAGAASLAVEDSGPALDDASIARLGERFFRQGAGEATGSGLGWSIVRRIAQVLGARIAVARSTSLGGLAVQVRFAPLP